METRIDKIRAALKDGLQPTHLTITDDSHLHIGHAGAQSGRGHYTIEITAKDLQGKSRLQQHKLIYQTLGSLMETDIHALRISVVDIEG